MASSQEIDRLRTRAEALLTEADPADAAETLKGMLEALDLGAPSDPREMLLALFDSPELRQHLETIEMEGVKLPRPGLIEDLDSLRSAMLL